MQHTVNASLLVCLSEKGFSLDELVRRLRELFERQAHGEILRTILLLVEEALKLKVMRQAEVPVACDCGHARYVLNGRRKPRRIRTSLGEVGLPALVRVKCARCGRTHTLLLRFLGVERNQTKTAELEWQAIEQAAADSLQWQGITPVFADVDPATHNLDPAAVERMITPRTTGIIGVHVWGRPCAVAALQAVADAHGLPLMFDAAHALGCSHGGRMIGNFGRCEVFSFHATKFFNTFEGGAIATNDDELAAKIRLMKNFGFKGFDNVVYLGVNGKMTEVCAAMGLTGLESLDDFMAVNRRNHEAYRGALAGIPGLRLIEYPVAERCNRQYVVVEVDEKAYGRSRDETIRMLHAENVLARKYFWPGCHRMEPYRTLYPEAGRDLPRTEEVAGRVVVLPTGLAVEPEMIRTIGELLGKRGRP